MMNGTLASLCDYFILTVAANLFAAQITQKWSQFGVAGTQEDLHIVLDALSGKRKWPKNSITNKDIIRLKLACDSMDIDARQSIFYTAINAFGSEGVNTNMYVSHCVLLVKSLWCFARFYFACILFYTHGFYFTCILFYTHAQV